MTSVRVERASPESPPPELTKILGPSFREFYSGDPWGERWLCPRCAPEGHFGPIGRYADPDLRACPVCDAELESYWSDHRVASYFQHAMSQPGAWLVVGYLDGERGSELAAWTWGYDAALVEELPPDSRQARYVDIVAVLPAFRTRVTYAFFEQCRDLLTANGRHMVTRTHTQSGHVHLPMRRSGWRPLDLVSQADGAREFWIYTGETG
jgi:hypothetical protein